MENYQGFNDSQNFQNSNPNNGNFMVSKLPNATASLVLGIFSIVCCCTVIVGLICSVIGLVLANKDIKLYQANPGQYSGIENINTARILNIIGLVLSILYLLYSIYAVMSIGGWDAYMNQVMEAYKQGLEAGQQ